jgi:hypothetical protein
VDIEPGETTLYDAIVLGNSAIFDRPLSLTAGVYTVTTTLEINITTTFGVYGSGDNSAAAATVIVCKVAPCFRLRGASKARFSGITVHGTLTPSTRHLAGVTSAATAGFQFTDVESVSMDNVVLTNFASGSNGAAIQITCNTAQACSNVTLTDVTLTNNTAAQFGGAMMLNLSSVASSAKFVFTRLTLTGNKAGIAGGAICWQRQAATTAECTTTAATMSFTDTVYSDNSAALWGNDIASDTCSIALAHAVKPLQDSGEQILDVTEQVPRVNTVDYYGATVQVDTSEFAVQIAAPVTNPATSQYWWTGDSAIYTFTNGAAALTALAFGAQPTSEFTFKVTATSTNLSRQYSMAFSVHTEQCAPGYHRNTISTASNGLYNCFICAVGSYNTQYEVSTCRICSVHYYCPEGAIDQTPCPARYMSGLASGACICNIKYFGISSVTGCTQSSQLVNGTVDCPTDGSKILTVYGDNFGTGSLSISVAGKTCTVLNAVMDTSIAIDSSISNNDTCTPSSGSATCKLPVGVGKLQFVTLSDITGSASTQVHQALHLLCNGTLLCYSSTLFYYARHTLSMLLQ